MGKEIKYQEKLRVVEQLQHVNATPLVLNNMEDAVVGGIRHLFETLERAARAIKSLEAENKELRALCKQHQIATPRKRKPI